MTRAPRPRLPLFTGKAVDRMKVAPPKEAAIHIAVATFLDRFITPGWLFTHVPNGERRDARTGAKLKRMGTKPGFPDLILIDPAGTFHGLELKTEGGRLSEAQEGFHGHARSQGWRVEVADSYDAAIAVLAGWGALRLTLKGVA